MKKILLLFVLLIVCSFDLVAQFKLSPEGVFLNEKTGKDFIVNTHEGVSQETLYRFVENKVIEVFKSSEDVISKTDDIISIFAYERFNSKDSYLDVTITYAYKILIYFKGNKIRYSVVPVSIVTNKGSVWHTYSFFDKNNKLKKSKTESYNKLNYVTNKLIAPYFYNDKNSFVDWE